ncbi:MAG: hypothetical protein ACRDK2_12205 [Solirubrobacteraceae bacterium]
MAAIASITPRQHGASAAGAGDVQLYATDAHLLMGDALQLRHGYLGGRHDRPA